MRQAVVLAGGGIIGQGRHLVFAHHLAEFGGIALDQKTCGAKSRRQFLEKVLREIRQTIGFGLGALWGVCGRVKVEREMKASFFGCDGMKNAKSVTHPDVFKFFACFLSAYGQKTQIREETMCH